MVHSCQNYDSDSTILLNIGGGDYSPNIVASYFFKYCEDLPDMHRVSKLFVFINVKSVLLGRKNKGECLPCQP